MQEVLHDRNQTLAYVHNQKAGSNTIQNSFEPLFRIVPLRFFGGIRAAGFHRRADGDNRLNEPNFYSTYARRSDENVVFTFVRDPAQMALAAYLEVRSRGSELFARTHGAEYMELWENLNTVLGSNRDGANSCRDRKHATEQYVTFLRALRNGTSSVGHELFHTFPQALKIDHVRPREAARGSRGLRYDAIGSMDALEHGMREVAALVHVRLRNASTLLADAAKMWGHTTQGLSCSNVVHQDDRVRRLVCELYAVDYVCFGYERWGVLLALTEGPDSRWPGHTLVQSRRTFYTRHTSHSIAPRRIGLPDCIARRASACALHFASSRGN